MLILTKPLQKMKRLLLALITVGIFGMDADAQRDEKIRVEITKEIDGEMQTFKGEYNSEEEMIADPEYQKFSGDDAFRFHFSNEEDLADLFGSFSIFDLDEDAFRNFHGPNGNNHVFHFNDEDGVIDLRFDYGQMAEEIEEEMRKVEELLEEVDEEIREGVMKSIENIEELSNKNHFRDLNTLSVNEVEDEFGKRGRVNKEEELELDFLSFHPRHSHLKIRFKVPYEGELEIKISTKDNKSVYSRYFESFGGYFTDDIDFSAYSDGDYLLEVTLGDEKLTRKITKD